MNSPDKDASMAPHTPPILSMQEAYSIPYGAVGFASDLVTLYMVTCLLCGCAPLYPARRIRNTKLAKFLTVTWIYSLLMLNISNVEQCWRYWELVLVNVSNGVMGFAFAVFGLGAVVAWDSLAMRKTKENDLESQPALEPVLLSTPEAETAVPDERICDSAREYSTMADIPSSGFSPFDSSSTQGQSNGTGNVNPQIGELARDPNNMAIEPILPQVRKVMFVCLPVLWAHIGMILIGNIALARIAIIESKGSIEKICLIFGILGGLILLAILCTFVYEFCYLGEGTGPGQELLRFFFVSLLAVLLMFSTDWILGCVLDSLSGVPKVHVDGYWVYLVFTKLPMFAF